MVSKLLAAGLLLNAYTGVSAFWRNQCFGRLDVKRIDPIVNLDEAAHHAHSLHGSSALTMSSTNADIMAGNCTSCAVKQDRSSYWFPSLYFQDSSTGKFELVPQVGGLLAYYLLRNPADNGKVKAFPEGFRMIAGTTERRSYTLGDPTQPDPPQSNWASLGQDSQADLKQRALGFNCLDYKKTPEGSLYRHYLPDKTFTDANCPNGIRIELMFPSCWNGKDMDSTDHQSHMAYPSLVGDGTCPPGFETRLITLFYETIWGTDSEQFKGRAGKWVLANGDPTGFGYHGDFMMGWPRGFLQDAADRCTNPSGEMTDCPVFMEAGPLQTEAEQADCKLEQVDLELSVATDLGTELDALPGNVPIASGPEDAPSGAAAAPAPTTYAVASITEALGLDTSTTSTPSTTSTLSPVTPTYSALGGVDSPAPSSSTGQEIAALTGGAFVESSSTTFATVTTSTPPPPPPPTTTPPPVTSESGVSYEVVSTQTNTIGNLVQEIVWEEAVVYVTKDSVTTTTVVAPSPSILKSDHKVRGHLRRHVNHGHQ